MDATGSAQAGSRSLPAKGNRLSALASWAPPDEGDVGELDAWRSRGFTRAMVGVIAIQGLLLLVFQLGDLIPFAPQGKRQAMIMIGEIVTSQLIALLAFHFTHSRTLAAQIANAGIYAAMVGAAIQMGGVSSPTLPILVLLPLLAALFSGATWSMVWTFVCIGTVIALRLMSEAGVDFPDMVKPESVQRGNAVVLCVTFLATGIAVVIYELLNRRLRETLASERTQFAYLADHDPLTGLDNRRGYQQHLDRAFRRASRVKQGVALIALDLDDFKPINDELGHAAGDELLRSVADRLRDSLRVTDTVARVGGDEFAILLEHVDSDADVSVVMGKVGEALRAPFTIAGREIHVGASLGAARYPDEGITPEELQSAADQAMYAAKRRTKTGD